MKQRFEASDLFVENSVGSKIGLLKQNAGIQTGSNFHGVSAWGFLTWAEAFRLLTFANKLCRLRYAWCSGFTLTYWFDLDSVLAKLMYIDTRYAEML